MAVSPDEHLKLYSAVDELEDGCHKDGLADHLMLQVDLLLMNSMEMSTDHLEVHEDLDDPDVEEESMTWSTVMLSTPMMGLLVMMDRWSSLLPGVGDGQQVACALLPCEMGWLILNVQSQDISEGDVSCQVILFIVILVSMITVIDGRCHCHWSMIVMIIAFVCRLF